METHEILSHNIDEIDTFFEEKSNKVNNLFDIPVDEMDILNDYKETFEAIGQCLNEIMKEKFILASISNLKNDLKGKIYEDLKFKNGLALKKADMDEYVYKNEKWIKITTAYDYQEGICSILENKYKFLNGKIYLLRDLREYHKIEIGVK
jgi:DNA mismatch repair ATPase MutL